MLGARGRGHCSPSRMTPLRQQGRPRRFLLTGFGSRCPGATGRLGQRAPPDRAARPLRAARSSGVRWRCGVSVLDGPAERVQASSNPDHRSCPPRAKASQPLVIWCPSPEFIGAHSARSGSAVRPNPTTWPERPDAGGFEGLASSEQRGSSALEQRARGARDDARNPRGSVPCCAP